MYDDVYWDVMYCIWMEIADKLREGASSDTIYREYGIKLSEAQMEDIKKNVH